MNNIQKILLVGVLVALVISVLALVAKQKPVVEETAFGGINHNVQEDFAEGISVDGTEVLDGDGVFWGDGSEGLSDTCASSTALTVANGIVTSCD